MARRCEICDRGTIGGASRSHSNIQTKRRLKVNLQWKLVGDKRLRLCTSCLKTLTKTAK